MNNKISEGKTMEYTNATGSTIAAGAPVKVGDMAGVAVADIADGETGVLEIEGVFTLPKVAGTAIVKGAEVALNSASAIVNVSSVYTAEIGHAYQSAATAAVLVNVKLSA